VEENTKTRRERRQRVVENISLMQKGTAFDDKEYENIGERKRKLHSPILDMAGDAATHPLSNKKKKKIKGKSNRKK
jgi:hypothetical protein